MGVSKKIIKGEGRYWLKIFSNGSSFFPSRINGTGRFAYLYIVDFFGGKLLLGSAWYLLNGFFNPVFSIGHWWLLTQGHLSWCCMMEKKIRPYWRELSTGSRRSVRQTSSLGCSAPRSLDNPMNGHVAIALFWRPAWCCNLPFFLTRDVFRTNCLKTLLHPGLFRNGFRMRPYWPAMNMDNTSNSDLMRTYLGSCQNTGS